MPRFAIFCTISGIFIVMASYATAGQKSPHHVPSDVPASLYNRIRKAVNDIPLIDTHEHLPSEEFRLKDGVSVRTMFSHYASSDLVSAGLPKNILEELRNPAIAFDESWPKVQPYWDSIRNTGYARCLLIAARDLYGVDDINEKTVAELSRRMEEKNKPGVTDWILREKAGIHTYIVDPIRPMSDTLARGEVRVRRFDHFISLFSRQNISDVIGNATSEKPTLDALLASLDRAFEKGITDGIVGVKSGLAYRRIIQYNAVSREEAESVFRLILSATDPAARLPFETVKPLQDFMMHEVARRAGEHHLPFQIHTGLQEGNGNNITNSNPTHLISLIQAHPETKFDLFHSGYPYMSELAVMAKNFPNVYADMCWMHIISPAAARRCLEEWIDTIPGNKILGFGGDFLFAEGSYGHAIMARENVTAVIAAKVASGCLTEKEGFTLARRILHDNAAALFNLTVSD